MYQQGPMTSKIWWACSARWGGSEYICYSQIWKKNFFFKKLENFHLVPPYLKKKFFFSDIDQNTKYRGLRCSSITLVKFLPGPPPTQSIGKKIFFLFFLADSENIYLSYVLRKKIFFSVLSTTFLNYISSVRRSSSLVAFIQLELTELTCHHFHPIVVHIET